MLMQGHDRVRAIQALPKVKAREGGGKERGGGERSINRQGRGREI